MSLNPVIPSCSPELRPPYLPDQEVMPGIKYGRPDELLSPAYWSMRCATADIDEIDFVNRHGSLAEEIGFCLLGGFGVTLEVATAFFHKLKDKGVFESGRQVLEQDLLQLLDSPAMVHGRPHRYRFPNQRARRIAKAMSELPRIELDPSDALGFRDEIQKLDGIGPKTASWITRNWLDTDEIAILDIHVLRAGWFLGIFCSDCRLPNHYLELERNFLIFAENLHVRASVLDSVMWLDMRTFGSSLTRVVVTD